MLDRIRVLPILIISASLLLGVKVDDVWRSAGKISFSTAAAQDKTEKSVNTDAKKTKLAAKDTGAVKETMGKAKKAGLKKAPAVKEISVDNLTQAELRVLQSLAKRRDEILQREKNLQMQSAILNATEKRINSKIAQLKELETRIQSMLKKNDDEAEKRIKSLVKVYKSMKPKDAARILENLDMKILLGVAERLKETKMAAVLAKMDPKKARLVTVNLATRRVLPKTGG